MSSSHRNSIHESAEYCCDTEMKVYNVKYVWTIDNFDFHEAEGGDLFSPTFSVGNNQIKWYLNIVPNDEQNGTKTVSVYVCLSDHTSDITKKKIYAKYSLAILNNQQKEVGYSDSLDVDLTAILEFEIPAKRKSYKHCIKKSADFRQNMLFNNKLTIGCSIVYSFGRSTLSNITRPHKIAPLYRNILACDLVENFGTLLENHKFSDVVVSVKNKEYRAHKTILAARSSVFAAMFEHNFKENETNRIEIEDMNEEVVAEMLRYIYTGKCENAEKFADGLLAAADKYDLNRLKMVCADALHKKLSVDNAVNILALADLHRVEELKYEAMKFIVNRFAEVVMSTAWKNILVSNPELIDEVCKAVARSTASSKRKNQDSSSSCKRSRFE